LKDLVEIDVYYGGGERNQARWTPKKRFKKERDIRGR